eukprot:PITA_09422
MHSSAPAPFTSPYTASSPRLRNHVHGSRSHSPTTHIEINQTDLRPPSASASLKSHSRPSTSPLPSKSSSSLPSETSSSGTPNIAIPPSVTPISSASPLAVAPISSTSPPSGNPSSPSPISQPSSSHPPIIGPSHSSLPPPPAPSLSVPPSIVPPTPVKAPSPLPHVQITSPLPAVPKPHASSKPPTPSTIFRHPRPSASSIPDSPAQTPHHIPFARPFIPPPNPLFPSSKPPSGLSFPPAEPSVKSTPKSDKPPGGIRSGPVIFALAVAGIIIFSVIGFIVWSIKRKRRIHHGDNYFWLFSGSSSYKAGQSSSRPSQPPQTPVRDYQNGYEGYINSIAGGTLGVPQTMNASSRGQLPDGQVVAVKQLKVGGGQGELEFQAEVEIIGRVHHRNLVSLVGYCITDSQRLLIYEYVPNGSLEQHLHGKGRPVMDWAMRSKIAIGSARGLAYLHEDCHPRIIHQDIKSSNILLDNNFEARVSDFGLAKLARDTYTHGTTRVMGKLGYLAPEYISSGKLTERSDVYSFGVLLLELVTGRRPFDTSQPVGNESLVDWVSLNSSSLVLKFHFK